jgi:hypothetical protein
VSSGGGAQRIGHAAARVAAAVGGFLLAISAAISYVIAGYADDAIDAGAGAAEDAVRSGQSGLDGKTADDAADWLHRLSDWAVSGRPGEFRTYALVALAAGIVAMVAALPRRPDAIWPEVVWGLTAVAGLAPNLAFDFWFSIWLFTGSMIAAAAVMHYLARRDDRVRQAGDAARRAGVAAAPHVQSAWKRGSRAATDAVARARGGPVGGVAPAAPAMPRATAPAVPGATAATSAAVADPPPSPPAGWYADPQRRAPHRWWDGSAWTDRTSS